MAIETSFVAPLAFLLVFADGNQLYGMGLPPKDNETGSEPSREVESQLQSDQAQIIARLSQNPDDHLDPPAFTGQRANPFLRTLIQDTGTGVTSRLPLSLVTRRSTRKGETEQVRNPFQRPISTTTTITNTTNTATQVPWEGRENGKHSQPGRTKMEGTSSMCGKGVCGGLRNDMGNEGISLIGRRNGDKRHRRETGNGGGGGRETYGGKGKGYSVSGHDGRGGMENSEETTEWSGYDEEGTGFDNGDDGNFGKGEQGGSHRGGRLTDGGQKGQVEEEEEVEKHVGHPLSDQHMLYNDLFKNYNRRTRPILSHDDVIKVQFEIALFNVLSLDSKNGVMITNSELIMKWNDPYLRWDPGYYNDTTSLRVPYEDVWRPDIILYNTADANYENSLIHTNVIIEHTGNCKLISHAVFTSVCNIDIQWFPFDQQTCPMIFASWTADVTQMVLVQGSSDITRYSPNHEFFMENFYSKAYEDFNPCCDKPFSMISIHIQLQRRVKFALFFFIVPGVLINVCALLVFSLPAETGEKMGLGVNALLAMIVFLMAMTEYLPPTETLPLAGIYYGVCLVVVTFNIAFSVYVLNLSYSGDRGYEVPMWMRIVTLFSAKVVFMKVPRFIEELWDLDENQKISKDKVRPFTGNFDPTNDPGAINRSPANVNAGDSDVIKDPIQRRKVAALEGMLALMTHQSRKAARGVEVSQLVEQWKYLSRVLDRVLLILFGITTFLFNLIILTQSPFSEKFEYCPLGPEMCGEEYDFKGDDFDAKTAFTGSVGGH